jgi:phage-related protein
VSLATKQLSFVGSAKQALSDLPRAAREALGHQLWRLEQGFDPNDFKPMKTVGPGVAEIRVDVEAAFRAFYVAKFPEAIYVLHAFNKTTEQTAQRDIEKGKRAYRALLAQRELDKQQSKKKKP